MSEPPALRIAALSIDCDDPARLAPFYVDLLGGDVLWTSARGSIGIQAQGIVLVLQRIVDYRPPTWPGASILHLDLDAGSDLPAAVARAISLGATEAPLQPDPRWRVLLDPAGHPFCLTTLTP